MALNGQLGKRRGLAVKRIEAQLSTIAGEDFKLPTFSRYGADMLLITQLEAMADCLDKIPSPEPEISTDKPTKSKRKVEANG